MKTYRFPCGCEFPILEERGEGELPLLDFDIENVRRDCPATFKLLSSGRTKGIFQLESGIGKRWTKAMKPENEEHLGALGSLLRPGALLALDSEGVSMTEHYCRRKNGQEEVPSYHPVVDELLKRNYNVMVYQEDAMLLAMKVAGLTELEADMLRAAIGKKLANEMAKCKQMFLDGAERVKIISREQAEELFSWIEKSQRYLFNCCCHKDLRVRRAAKGRFSNEFYTVEEMYNIRNDLEYAKKTGHEQLRRKWKRIGNYGKGYSLCSDGRIRPNIIAGITKSGLQPVWRISLENGKYIDVTIKHKFPTKKGEMRLAEIIEQKIDELLFCGEYEKTDYKKYNFSSVGRDDRFNPDCGVAELKNINRCFTNGSYTDFRNNDKIIPRVCSDCGSKDRRLELHHVDGNRENSKIDNLMRLCASCHKKREYAAGRVKRGEKGYPSKWVKIKSIEYIGIEETYDVTMEGPNHTFVTDQDIVTCNSHAMSYGITGYDTAYLKAHFPVAFFSGWLANAKHKSKPLDEVCELINDAKIFDVNVLPPDLRNLNEYFQTDGKKIWFGIGNIKGIGSAQLKNIINQVEHVKTIFEKYIGNLSWVDFLVNFADKLSSSVITKLIECGAVNWFGMSRTLMKAEYDVWNFLTPPEIKWIEQNRPEGSLKEILRLVARPKKEGGGCATKNRVSAVLSQLHLLENPPSPLVDSPSLIAFNEEQLLGIPITYTNIDSCDISSVNCSCKEFLTGRDGFLMLGVQIKDIREFKTKKGAAPGSKMARMVIDDGTCQLDAIVFPQVYKEKSDILFKDSTVIIQAEHGKDQNELIVKKVWQAQMI